MTTPTVDLSFDQPIATAPPPPAVTNEQLMQRLDDLAVAVSELRRVVNGLAAPTSNPPVQQNAPARQPQPPTLQNRRPATDGRSAYCDCEHKCWLGYSDAAANDALPCACTDCLNQWGKPCGCIQPQPGLFLREVGTLDNGRAKYGWLPYGG